MFYNNKNLLMEPVPVVVGGPCDVQRLGIGMTINVSGILFQRHSIILTTNNCTNLLGLLSTHLHNFQVIE